MPNTGWTCFLFCEKDEVLGQFNFIISIFFVVLVAIFSLEIILYYIVYKRLTNPLTRLAQMMSHPMDEHSTYRHFSYDKDDEIGIVSRSYNQMIETIDQLVQHLNRGSEGQISADCMGRGTKTGSGDQGAPSAN